MKLLSPTLSIDKIATANLIEEAVLGLQGKEDPFLVLKSDELTYVQVLWVGSSIRLVVAILSILNVGESSFMVKHNF